MKTNHLIMILAAAVTVGGFIVYQAKAFERGEAGRFRGGPILKRVAERLNLSDEQRAQIKAVLRNDQDALINLFTQLHAARKGLREAIHASDANESSVRAAAAKVAAVEADLAVERLKLHGKINPILTDEQRENAAEMEKHLDEFVDGIISRIGK
jgi:Spy/CpxP family protein refolding chaperone